MTAPISVYSDGWLASPLDVAFEGWIGIPSSSTKSTGGGGAVRHRLEHYLQTWRLRATGSARISAKCKIIVTKKKISIVKCNGSGILTIIGTADFVADTGARSAVCSGRARVLAAGLSPSTSADFSDLDLVAISAALGLDPWEM